MVIMSLSTLIKNQNICEICEKKQLNSFFQIPSLPTLTINNFKYTKSSKSSNKKFKVRYCSHCKVIILDKKIKFNILYKNFINKQPQNNFIKSEIKKKLNQLKKVNILNIGKNSDFIEKKDIKNINYLKFDPTITKEDSINKKFHSLPKLVNKYRNKVDLIILDNFISNIIDINKTLLILKSLLSKNGKILIYTNYSPFNILRNDINCFYHEHVYYFSLKSLLILFKKNGLYLRKFKFSEDGAFMHLIFEKKQNFINKNLRDKLNQEESYDENFYLNFKKNLKKNSTKIKNILKENYVLYGYGCSIGAITSIIKYNLEERISMLIDDNPIVNNIYLNKKKISIVKINDVKFENKRKIIFCLIPRHYKNILPKIKKYMKKNDILVNLVEDFSVQKF
jgi:hypothetical protein